MSTKQKSDADKLPKLLPYKESRSVLEPPRPVNERKRPKSFISPGLMKADLRKPRPRDPSAWREEVLE